MAKGISDLGNGLGFVYVVAPNGTTIYNSIPNVSQVKHQVNSLGSNSRSIGQNLIAIGSITVSSISGSGDITDILIDSIDQISANISYTALTSTTGLATSIKTAINNHTPSGFNYTARSYSNVVYIYAPLEAGSSVNGEAITVSNTGNLTVSTVDLSGGTDASELYDESVGYRFFLDADYGSTTYSGGGTATMGDISNAVEITSYVVPKMMNSAFDVKEVTISSGEITTQTRNSSITQYRVTNEGAAATDTLSQISPTNFANGDILILTGDGTSSYFTISTETGNLSIANSGVNIGLTSYQKNVKSSIALYYEDGIFYELWQGANKSNKAYQNLTDGSTITWNLLDGANAQVTLGGNRTLDITNEESGDRGILIVTQDSTGGRTLTFPANSKFEEGPIALSATGGFVDILEFTYNGSYYYWKASFDYSSL